MKDPEALGSKLTLTMPLGAKCPLKCCLLLCAFLFRFHTHVWFPQQTQASFYSDSHLWHYRAFFSPLFLSKATYSSMGFSILTAGWPSPQLNLDYLHHAPPKTLVPFSHYPPSSCPQLGQSLITLLSLPHRCLPILQVHFECDFLRYFSWSI